MREERSTEERLQQRPREDRGRSRCARYGSAVCGGVAYRKQRWLGLAWEHE